MSRDFIHSMGLTRYVHCLHLVEGFDLRAYDSSRFRSPLLTGSRLIFIRLVTEMFLFTKLTGSKKSRPEGACFHVEVPTK